MLCIAAVVGIVPTVAQYVLTPNLANFVNAILCPLAFGLLLGLARLNHDGHVNSAGVSVAIVISAVIIVDILISDFTQGGFTWADTSGWDAMVAVRTPHRCSHRKVVAGTAHMRALLPRTPGVCHLRSAAPIGPGN